MQEQRQEPMQITEEMKNDVMAILDTIKEFKDKYNIKMVRFESYRSIGDKAVIFDSKDYRTAGFYTHSVSRNKIETEYLEYSE